MLPRILSVAAVIMILSASRVYGFQIDGVTVSPFQPNTLTPVDLLVSITAPSAPAYLFAPTVTQFSGNSISVDLFVGSGMLTVITPFETKVDLGLLSDGVYDYTVTLTTEFPVGWGTDKRVARGSFNVVPAASLLPGDVNRDGAVDAADYALLRHGTAYTPDRYDVWRAQFGQSGGSTELHSADLSQRATPEPASFLIAALGAVALLLAGRNGRGEIVAII